MELRTINRWLRLIGLVLVVQVGGDEPTMLRLERASRHPLIDVDEDDRGAD